MTAPNPSTRPSMRGYSLAEVLVATAIFTIIFVAALMIYDRSNRVFKTGVEAGDLQQQVRVTFDRLVADIRMAGFDYDRDGSPSGAQKYQQPDEQFEYVGPSALTIRGNLDAELDAANENGRETAYEPATGEFPVVTTANDEIVTYALRSVSGPNPDTIVFYADTRRPRRTYPGGSDEQTVTIPGVDLCTNGCMNPPYTLFRITLRDADLTNPATANDFVFTPVADNIRSVRFSYFQDHRATVPVTPNGGAGQFLVSGAGMLPAAVQARALRENIASVRVEVVGMNSASEFGYVSPVETALPAAQQVASARSFRQYQLQSLVVPRNVGLRGMQEFDTNPPGAPTVLGVTAAGCGVAVVRWQAPVEGIVDGYAIQYDTNPVGTFSSVPLNYGQALEGHVQGLDPSKTYYFIVVATNSNGTMRSVNTSVGLQPRNPTQAGEPVIGLVSGAAGGPPPKEGAIDVAFALPTTNFPPNDKDWPAGGDATQIPLPVKGELTATRVLRYFSDAQPPETAVGEQVWPPAAGSPVVAPAIDDAGNGTFSDTSPLVSCRPYWYRLVGVETACASSDALNVGVAPAGGTLKDLALSRPSLWSVGKSTTSVPPAKGQMVSFVGGSSCSGPTCTVDLQWPQVITDAAVAPATPKPILVTQYEVRRVTPESGAEFIFPATDTNLGDNIVQATDPTSPPKPATYYAYSVRAVQTGGADCTATIPGEWSDPKNFPCIQLGVSIVGTAAFDGDGSAASPWMVSGSVQAYAQAQAGATLATATATLHDAATGTQIGPELSGTLMGNAALFSVPETSDGSTYMLRITVADASGCSNTEVRYLTDPGTSCCLAPFRFQAPPAPVIDPDIAKQSDTTVSVMLKNICGDSLTLKSVTINWPASPEFALLQVEFPSADGLPAIAVVNPGAMPPGSDKPPVTVGVSPLLPANALTKIGGNTSTYVIHLTYSKPIPLLDEPTFTVTPIYARTGIDTTCPIVQTPVP